MVGASSPSAAWVRAADSAAAEARMASAAACSAEVGAGAPMVRQAEDLALRNSALLVSLTARSGEDCEYVCYRMIHDGVKGCLTCQGTVFIILGRSVLVPA